MFTHIHHNTAYDIDDCILPTSKSNIGNALLFLVA